MQVNVANIESDDIDVSRYHSWNKLLRVTGYVFKAVSQKSDEPKDVRDELKPLLDEKVIKVAESYWIRKVQKDMDLSLKKYQQLSPDKDENGIIRIDGRLKNMPCFDEDRKHPILLPKNHEICKLITKQAHEECLHSGHLRVMAEVRKRFWIVGLRTLAKSIGSKCVVCRRWRGSSMEQKMADLPSFRLTPSSPFENSAIDYFGPFKMKYGHRSYSKAYGVIFTCLTTRSIHVDLATDVSTDKFLLALRRFISLYGAPKFVRSDNGRNFVGAANEIRNMLKS